MVLLEFVFVSRFLQYRYKENNIITVTLVFFGLIVNACITVKPPTLIDRATVMEAESANKWPAFEKNFLIEIH